MVGNDVFFLHIIKIRIRQRNNHLKKVVIMTKRDWLINIRNSKQMTQQEVAYTAFIDRAYYAQIESGARNPSGDVTKRIGDVLGFHYTNFERDENSFTVSLRNSPMTLAHCDLDLRYTWVFNPIMHQELSDLIGKRDTDILNNDGSLALMKLKRDILEQKIGIRRKITYPNPTGTISYDVYGQPLLNEKGIMIGVTTAATELVNS